MAAQAA
ncbi:hypothetical protein D049_2352, partial [Vibrio parahaemolyticus VPTS-2010]